MGKSENCVRLTSNISASGAKVYDIKWSVSEKELARCLFEAALAEELAEVMAEFKAKAAAVALPEDMWSIQEYLFRKRREVEEKYDYRYSQLLLVFGRLVREGRVREAQLAGLSEEKLSFIRRIASL
jgi:hypothetical protein